jgi:Heparinase II/III-like protein
MNILLIFGNPVIALTLGFVSAAFLFLALGLARAEGGAERPGLAPHTYREDFESGELRAWASYPPNQDNAYDPYVYPGRIQPGDAGRCLVVKCEPPWNQDQSLGAVKLLDLYLDPAFWVKFRYFLKTANHVAEIRVDLPLADGRRLVVRRKNPRLNAWTDFGVIWSDLLAQGQVGPKDSLLRLSALAITATVPAADPDMPVFLGLTDIEVRGLREMPFEFTEPRMITLSEWPERIPLRHFRRGEALHIAGTFDFAPGTVELTVVPFIDREKVIMTTPLRARAGGLWATGDIVLGGAAFPPGLYRGVVAARNEESLLSSTPFVIFLESPGGPWAHPRVLVEARELARFRARFLSPEYAPVLERFLSRAKTYRDLVRFEKVVYDIDQFPEKDWNASLPAWYKDRFMTYREALFTNSVTYASGRDEAAGPFLKTLLVKLAAWPGWNHPWMEARGFHTYYPLGEFADAFATAYDTVFSLMSEEERRSVREGLLRNYVRPAFRTYVEHNQVTSNSSNWISHIAGGALISLLAMAHDDTALADLEPWLTGFLLKMHKYIATVFGRDGSYGEGFRYYNFAMQSCARTLSPLERVFNIDLSGRLAGSHQETLWSTIVPKNISFGFGDTESYLKQEAQAWWIGTENGPMNSWTWLLEKTRDPYLAWLYRGLKESDTVQEVVHETADIPAHEPSSLGTVRFFPEVGTAVFKSGWQEDDFCFVFRSGPFFNHQHLDQGSFYLADRGEVFLEERYDGEHHYYDDPVYRSHAIQPISHNTILLDRNPQSQKAGDPKGFSPGLNDQARLENYLDAEGIAFATGDIGRLYREKVRALRRHVLFIKPRLVVLIDEVLPADSDVELNLLFHTRWKKDIRIRPGIVSFDKPRGTLYLVPILPEKAALEVLREPHFLYQYAAQPLIERGYLQISVPTKGRRLILANLLTSVKKGEAPPVIGIAGREEAATVTFPGAGGDWRLAVTRGGSVSLEDWAGDGLLLTLDPRGRLFTAEATFVARNGARIVESPVKFSGQLLHSADGFAGVLRMPADALLKICTGGRPARLLLNGRPTDAFTFSPETGGLSLACAAGETKIEVNYER